MPWVSFENDVQLQQFTKRLDENNIPYQKSKRMCKDGLSVFASEQTAALLSQHIREFYEGEMIQNIYHKRYRSFLKKLENDRICELGTQFAHEDISVENKLRSELLQFMKKTEKMFVKGLADFRLKQYKDALEENIERGIENYTYEREAESFIDLLRYFVNIQEPQYRLVHVVMDTDIYFVLDEQYREIHYSDATEIQEENFSNVSSNEDWLLSVLITVAPQKIILHDAHQRMPKNFLDTLEKVFENRLKICDGCSYCKNFFLKS